MESSLSQTASTEKGDCDMIKASKVVFISSELEEDFNQLTLEDPVKKGMIRAINDLKENAFSGIQIPKRLFPKEYVQNTALTICGNTTYHGAGDCFTQ